MILRAKGNPGAQYWMHTTAMGVALVALCLATGAQGWAQSSAPQKLPREQQIDKDIEYLRDPVTGELRVVPKRSASGGTAAPSPNSGGGVVIRSEVRLIEIGCSALSANGATLQNLALSDFQLATDGEPQSLVHLDTSTEPAHLALVIDASPSEFHSLDEMRVAARALGRELSPRDEVAVVAFAGHPHILLPFSTDRKLLEAAIGRLQVLRAVEETGSNIYGSVYLTAQRLFTGPHATAGRKAILLLTDGQDSGLGLSWNPESMVPVAGVNANRLTFEDVVRQLAGSGIEIFVISTENRPKGVTESWLDAHSNATLISTESRKMEIPAYTAFLAELVRRAGGTLYFLRETGTLSDVYRRIAATLRTEYTLGFYPSASVDKSGWHAVTVRLSQAGGHPGARLDCRPNYYVPSSH
jgi:VWFA-related protein